MEKIIDVLDFLNQIELFNVISGLEYNTFIIIRKILMDEFSNVDFNKLKEVIGILDNLYIAYIRNKLHFDKSLITILRGKIFEMYEQKMIEESDNA